LVRRHPLLDGNHIGGDFSYGFFALATVSGDLGEAHADEGESVIELLGGWGSCDPLDDAEDAIGGAGRVFDGHGVGSGWGRGYGGIAKRERLRAGHGDAARCGD